MKPKLHLQMSETVVFGYLIVVNPIIFFSHRHDIHRDLRDVGDGDQNTVFARSSLDSERGFGTLPKRQVGFWDGEVFAVVGELQVVDIVVPWRRRSRLEREGFRVEENAEGLDPGVVPGPSLRPETDKAGVDLEVEVGDQAEVLVLLAVEVEDDAVAADEPRVQARRAEAVAVWFPVYSRKKKGRGCKLNRIISMCYVYCEK